MECLNKFREIFFDYEINVSSDHKNLVYVETLSESQRVMRRRLILKDFGPNIQHIAGVDNIAEETLSRLPYRPSDKYKPCTKKAQCCANELFTLGRIENNKYCLPINLLIVQREQQK